VERAEKERVVAELVERLRGSDSLIVADYRGLKNSELQELRARLYTHGARFTVVKNTLTRRAAEAAGAESLLALLDGPTAIAFVTADGDPVAVAKALADTARQTKILTLRGGMLQGSPISGDDVESLAKLPPLDVLQGQLVGVIVAPLTQLISLLTAPLRDLVGLIDARIAQLQESEPAAEEPTAAPAEAEPQPQDSAVAEETPETDETEAPDESPAAPEVSAELEAETTTEAAEEPEPEAADADEAGEE
jgi:large subunit ribosomal protein L10